ncbi:MAG: hypothetical protein N3I35_19440 [Clostridia bacterium]|nr:hypothetical protein [Clostridia bacterium]
MFNIFSRTVKKNRQRKNITCIAEEPKTGAAAEKVCHEHAYIDPRELLSNHISKYTGSTVTVYVCGGGVCSLGFTGVLISSNSSYIRLLTRISSPPAYPLFYVCQNCPKHLSAQARIWSLSMCTPSFSIFYPGSIACIPLKKITGFIHNAL